MTTLAIERVLALPDPLTANTLYMVADVNNINVHFVVTGNNASVALRTYSYNDILNFINDTLLQMPPSSNGTVTSVGISVPTGLEVAGGPVTNAGDIIISYAAGYSIPVNSKQSQWDAVYGWGDHAGAGYYKAGGALGTPASGDLRNCTVDGTVKVGYRGITQNQRSVAYVCALTDDGKHIYQTSNGGIGIPGNVDVAFPIGAAITFVAGASAISIPINFDVMRLAGAGTTGTRTLAAYGVATAIKITATEWRIVGTGLT